MGTRDGFLENGSGGLNKSYFQTPCAENIEMIRYYVFLVMDAS